MTGAASPTLLESASAGRRAMGNRAQPRPETTSKESAGTGSARPEPDVHPGDSDHVGYGSPPRKYQFSKGASGNPSGRPPGRHNYKKRLAQLLNGPIDTRDGRQVMPEELVAQAVYGQMAKGNLKAV